MLCDIIFVCGRRSLSCEVNSRYFARFIFMRQRSKSIAFRMLESKSANLMDSRNGEWRSSYE